MRGRDEQAEHIGFLGQRNYSVGYYNGRHVTICVSKPTEYTIPRVNPNVNSGLLEIMTCH